MLRADRYTALIDACSLHGALSRNLILSLAEAGFFRPRWSADILTEFERSLADRFQDPKLAAEQRARIERAFPEAEVKGYADLTTGLNLPDDKDRHVLAAALMTRAAVIVTENLSDFPNEIIGLYTIEAKTADDFISDMLDLDLPAGAAVVSRMRRRLNRPTLNPSELLTLFEKRGLATTAEVLQPYTALL